MIEYITVRVWGRGQCWTLNGSCQAREITTHPVVIVLLVTWQRTELGPPGLDTHAQPLFYFVAKTSVLRYLDWHVELLHVASSYSSRSFQTCLPSLCQHLQQLRCTWGISMSKQPHWKHFKCILFNVILTLHVTKITKKNKEKNLYFWIFHSFSLFLIKFLSY